MVWIIGRTQTNGAKDYPAVHAIQDRYKLVPLSSYGKPCAPPEGNVDPGIDMKTPPVEQLKKMSAETYFNRLATLLKSNPPPASEASILEKLKAIGIVPGEKFDPAKLDPSVAKGLQKSVAVALEKLDAASEDAGAPVNGVARSAHDPGQLRQRLRRARSSRWWALAPTCRRTRSIRPPSSTAKASR